MPLSVYSAKAGLSETEREQIVESIDASVSSKDETNETSTWTGDVHGFHELHNHPVYQRLFGLIGDHVRRYIDQLNINTQTFDYYYTRSWASRQTKGRQIDYHRHEQSHFSVVYYPKVPTNSGAFCLATDNHQNEIVEGMFRHEYYDKGIIKTGASHTMAEIPLDVTDDDLLIFPSKTAHRTGVSDTDKPRYSIASDLLCVLRDADSFEIGLPPIHTWKKA
jgi:uncharacterized protein (TIGR02466 family)